MEDFIDGCHGDCLGYRNGTIFAIKNRHPMPLIKFQLNLTFRLGGKVFQDGRHSDRLGYRNRKILAF